MPIPSADLALIRTRPQAQGWHLCVHRPATMWYARVNGDHTEAATTISFTGATELESPFGHSTVYIGTTQYGKEIGVLRFKSKNDGDSTIEVSSNGLELLDGYYLTIKKVILPLSILPSIDGTMEDSTKTYTDENSAMHPLARVGPPAAGYLSEGGEFPVDFWNDDVATADGASLSSYAWTFENGTPSTSTQAGTESSPIEVMFNAASGHQGFWVNHTVTDSNSKTHTRCTQVFVFDEDTPSITAFEVNNLSGDRDSGGWRATIVVKESANEDEFPDYAQVVVFNEQYWGGTRTDIGYDWTGRENILFVGYILRDTVHKEPETGYVTFEVASIVEIMKELTAWGAALKKNTAPAWHNIPNMTLNKAVFHVITEHSTIDHIADIYLNLDAISMNYIDLTEGKLYEQLKTGIGEAGRAVLLNNKVGQVYVEPNVQYVLVADRGSIDEMFALDHDDWRDNIDLGAERSTKQVCQVDFIGFYYESNGNAKSLASLAPARQYESGSVQKVTGVRVDTQTECNNYAAVFGGAFNNEFENVILPMAGFWPVFDIAPQRYILITLAESDTQRGIVWSGESFVVKGVSFTINNEHGYCLTDVVVERASIPIGATTNVIPEIVIPEPPAPPAPPAPPTIPEESDWGVVIFAMHVVARCKDFFTTDENQHWTDITPTDLDVDQEDPSASVDEIYALSVNKETGETFLSTSVGIYYTSNINNTEVNWTLILDESRVTDDTGLSGGRFGAIKTHGGRVVIPYVKVSGWRSAYYRGTAASLEPVFLPWASIREGEPPSVTTKYAAFQSIARVHGYNVDYVNDKFKIGLARRQSASSQAALLLIDAFDEGADKYVMYSYYGDSDHIGCMTATYVQTYEGDIYTHASGASWYSAATSPPTYEDAVPTYGMDELNSNLLHTNGAGKLYYNGVEIAENTTLFGVLTGEAFRAIFTRNNTQEILCVNSEEVDLGESKAIVIWTDSLFQGSPTKYDKTGDYLSSVGNWGGGNVNRGNAGAQLYRIYKYQ